MFNVIIYFFILLVTNIYIFLKKDRILLKILITLYTCISLISLILINYGKININGNIINEDSLSLVPFLYLCIVYFCFFAPFFSRRFSASKINVNINNNYIYIGIVYVICTIIAIKCYFPGIQNLINDGNYAINRMNLYNDSMIMPYSNIIEFMAIQFSGYFRLFAVVLGFQMLKNSPKKNYDKIGLIIIASTLLYTIVTSMYTSSRGSIINFFTFLFALFLFYFNSIESNKKLNIIIGLTVIIPLLIVYIYNITISRFEEESLYSVLLYLGQSPIVFANNIFNLPTLAFGKYGLGQLFGIPFSESDVGGSWASGFFTFVGWLYIDWGLIGVLLIGIICFIFIVKIINKKRYGLSDLMIILLYYQTLLNGVFVIGRSYIYTILGNVLIIIFLKIFVEGKKYKVRI